MYYIVYCILSTDWVTIRTVTLCTHESKRITNAFQGSCPLCRAIMDIVSKPRVWNYNTEAVSFESRPTFEIQGSGRAAIPALLRPNWVPVLSPRLVLGFRRRTLRGMFPDIEEYTSASAIGTLLEHIRIYPALRIGTHSPGWFGGCWCQ